MRISISRIAPQIDKCAKATTHCSHLLDFSMVRVRQHDFVDTKFSVCLSGNLQDVVFISVLIIRFLNARCHQK